MKQKVYGITYAAYMEKLNVKKKKRPKDYFNQDSGEEALQKISQSSGEELDQ